MILRTISEYRTFARCPLKRHFAYTLKLRPKKKNPKFAAGDSWHAAVAEFMKTGSEQAGLDAFDAVVNALPSEAWADEDVKDQLTRARALARAYADVYGRVGEGPTKYDVLATEKEFVIPFPVFENGTIRKSETIQLGGKIDQILRERDTGIIFLVERKTSDGSNDPESPLLSIDSQVSMYTYAAWFLFHTPTLQPMPVLYDVAHKPKHKRKESEPTHEFENRLYKIILDEPDKYFQQSVIIRSQNDILRFLQELNQIEAAIELGLTYRVDNFTCNWSCPYQIPCVEPTQEIFDSLYEIKKTPHDEL